MKLKQIGSEGCTNSAVKRIFSLILSFVMLLTIVAELDLSVYADEYSGKCGDNVFYQLNPKTGVLEISGTGEMNYWYDVENNLSFSSVKEIIVDYGVTSIGRCSFFHCENLISLNLSNSVTVIESMAFEGCQKLKNIKWSENLNEIGYCAFGSCYSLENVIFPEKIESLGQWSFHGCKNLKSVYLPLSIQMITSPFTGCFALKDVYYEGTEEQFNSIEYIDSIFDGDAETADLQDVNIHYNYKSIGNNKFNDIQSSEYVPYSDYVMYTSVYNSYIVGTNPPYYTEFSPRTAITRAMFVAILYRMAGNPYDDANPYTSNPFSDINTNAYYYNAACWALDEGITNQKTFKPNDNVTREQTARFLFAYAESNGLLGDEAYKNVNLGKYPDYSSVHSWAVEPLQWANYNDMITGTQQGYINPQGATQRIHATRILYGFGKVCNIGNFE